MASSGALKEAAALGATGAGGWVSLHTADPGTTGASEVAGGSPAYARKQTTWTGGASDGVVAGSAVSIDVPAGTYTHVGIWSASTAGTFLTSYALPTAIVMSVQGQITVTPTYTQS